MTNRKLKTKQKNNILIPCLVCLLLSVMIFSGYKVVSTTARLNAEKKAFDELAQIVEAYEKGDEISAPENPVETVNPDNSTETSTGSAVSNPPKFVPTRVMGYQALKDMNSDFYGWLFINDTKINYPVMESPNEPEFYLRKGFDKKYSLSGSLFTDYRCTKEGGNLIIYGHHMKNGVMFGSLPEYAKQEYYEAHKYINFDTLGETGTYQVLAAFYSKIYKEGEEGFRYYDYYDLSKKSDFDKYVRKAVEASEIDSGISAGYGDQLLTLSTCNYHSEDGRFVIVAVKIN